MIIEDTVEMKWNTSNRKYYSNKGYDFTSLQDIFVIKTIDLNPNSPKIIIAQCDICGKIKNIQYRGYINSVSNCNFYACSRKCSSDKVKQTCLNRYGVEHDFQSKIVKDKIKQTCLEKYGVDNAAKSERSKITAKATFLKKYGVENPYQSEIVKDKIKQTCLIRYGFTHHTKNKLIRNKILDSQINKYGEIWKNIVPRYNTNSIIYFDNVSNILGIKIQHALNGGEKKVVRYFIDGYIEKYNISIEWDEIGHKYNKIDDIKRENFISNKINCKFIRINKATNI